MIDPTKHRQLEELDTVNLCTQIFTNARNELYLNMHYLDLALSSFGFEADPTLSSVATDGFVIYYRPEWVFAMYKRGRVHINRVFLHMVFHCLFCHLDTRGKRAKDYWNLACDIAMESVIDGLYKKCVHVPPSPYRRELYLRLGKQMPVLTAEGIYDALQNMNLNERQYERMAEEFLVDDHSFWDLPEDSPKTPMVRQTQWSNNREKVQTEMETMGNQQDEENNRIDGDVLGACFTRGVNVFFFGFHRENSFCSLVPSGRHPQTAQQRFQCGRCKECEISHRQNAAKLQVPLDDPCDNADGNAVFFIQPRDRKADVILLTGHPGIVAGVCNGVDAVVQADIHNTAAKICDLAGVLALYLTFLQIVYAGFGKRAADICPDGKMLSVLAADLLHMD